MDVLQSDLTASDELVALRLADLDLSELLRATLVNGHGHHPEASTSVRTQEVGGVGESNRLEPRLLIADLPDHRYRPVMLVGVQELERGGAFGTHGFISSP